MALFKNEIWSIKELKNTEIIDNHQHKAAVSIFPASPLVINLEITMDFETDWTWNPQLIDKSSSSYKLLTSVMGNTFEDSWKACADHNELEVETKIRYLKGENIRARRAATSATSVSIKMDFNSIKNITNINTPEDINSLEANLIADLNSDLRNAAELNDNNNILPANFTPSFISEIFLSFESYDEPVTSTTFMTPTTIETIINPVDNEKIVEIESYISKMTEDMEKLSIVDIDLVDDVSELEKVIAEMTNEFLKKVKPKKELLLVSDTYLTLIKTKQEKLMEMMMVQALYTKAPSYSQEVESRIRQSEHRSHTELISMESRLLDIMNVLATEILSPKTD